MLVSILYSLWVLERLIWPIKPYDSYPGSADGKLPADWQYIFELLETLTYVAAKTNKIALGTSVIDMLFHNPVILARRFTTLDVLSEGRALAGFGIGWSKNEYQVSNIPFKERGKRANEYIEILKKIWTEVDHLILNFDRLPINNYIDNIIDISKQLSGFIR
jgi:alkanesulfonate monooxygenase SsuD/methylene tetrahydromethanopterin reductase-like flavin-dependent oxidoreductase (luciferase family)